MANHPEHLSFTAQPSSRLLSLPAELRMRIYDAILSPTGTLTLTRTGTKRHALLPPVRAASFLCVCRQIHSEARHIPIHENEICVRVDAHDNTWPTLSGTRLPQRTALERIRKLCVVLECCSAFFTSYGEVDWRPFEALVELKVLRLVVVYSTGIEGFWPDAEENGAVEDGEDEGRYRRTAVEMLTEVLTRVPRSVEVLCEVEEHTPQCNLMLRVLASARAATSRPELVERAPEHVVSRTVAMIPESLRGVKSGGNPDVYEEVITQSIGHI